MAKAKAKSYDEDDDELIGMSEDLIDDDDIDDDDGPVAPEAKLDASSRRILVLEPDEVRCEVLLGIFKEVLTGAHFEVASEIDEAQTLWEEEAFDTVVVDFMNEGTSDSEFIKAINNDSETILIAFSLDGIDLTDDKNKYRLDPVKKLFEVETKNAKSA